MSDNEKPRWDPVDIMVLRRGEVSLPLPCLFLAFQPMEFDNTTRQIGGKDMTLVSADFIIPLAMELR